MSSRKRKESKSHFAFFPATGHSVDRMIHKWLIPAFVTLGVGKIPFAPGTWGSLVGLLIWWAIYPLSLNIALLIMGGTFAISMVAVHLYEKHGESHDPKEVIIDEVLGIWLTLLAVPLTPGTLTVGFVLFRLLDIIKPYPISFIDRHVPGALGTLCDDILAGLLARIVLGYLVSLELQWMM